MVKRIRVGIAAMAKKANSKPMKQIVRRFEPSVFEFIYFGDERLLNEPIEEWPLVDYLIAWHSGGYPLDKVIEYVNLRHPLVINDVSMQKDLLDRRRIYQILREHNISTPRHIILNDSERINNPNIIIENEDYIEIKGIRFNKPVVEKPIDAEDHNIYIYYPLSAGGGSKRLFRKIGDKSSQFYPEINEVRKEGSYIYEEFIETQGVDVKVYTVGPNYGHAEARKSPVIDGKVNRNADGSETRYPVILSSEEKIFANKVCIAFKQGVCGFDILRVHGKSYVCDVNGWSFVKTSTKYFDDCAQLLSEIIWTSVRHKGFGKFSAVAPLTIHGGGGSLREHAGSGGGSGSFCSGSGTTPPTKFNHLTGSNKLLTRESFKGKEELEVDIDEQATNEIDAEVEAATYDHLDGNKQLFLKPAGHRVDYYDERTPSTSSESSTLSSQQASSQQGPGQEAYQQGPGQEAYQGPGALRSKTSYSVDVVDEEEASEELRCVIAVIRHGDRTPKQKLKFVVDLYDQSCDFQMVDSEHECLGISSLFLPYFTFFHAFLDADYEASQVEMNRARNAAAAATARQSSSSVGGGGGGGDGGGELKDSSNGSGGSLGGGGTTSTSALKGGLAAALRNDNMDEVGLGLGSTAAAVAIVQTEVLSPPSWSESLIKSFHKLLTNPNSSNSKNNHLNKKSPEQKDLKSTKRHSKSSSPKPPTSPSSSSTTSTSSSSSSMFSFSSRKQQGSGASLLSDNGDKDGDKDVDKEDDEERIIEDESVNLHISSNEVISRVGIESQLSSDIDVIENKNKDNNSSSISNTLSPDSSCAKKAAAEVTKSLIVDQERADYNGSLTRAEGAELLRAARMHLEMEKTATSSLSIDGDEGETLQESNGDDQTLQHEELSVEVASMFNPPSSPQPSTLKSMFDTPNSPNNGMSSTSTAPSTILSSNDNNDDDDAKKQQTIVPTNVGILPMAPPPSPAPSVVVGGVPPPTSDTDVFGISLADIPLMSLSSSTSSIAPSESSSKLSTHPNAPSSPPPPPPPSSLIPGSASPMRNKTPPPSSSSSSSSTTPPPSSPSQNDRAPLQLKEGEGIDEVSKKVSSTSSTASPKAIAPLKKDVKVKSKEGLKSFLATTERVKEMLLSHYTPSDPSSSPSEGDTQTTDTLPTATTMKPPSKTSEALMAKLQQITDVLGHGEITGVTRKLQIKGIDWVPIFDSDDEDSDEEDIDEDIEDDTDDAEKNGTKNEAASEELSINSSFDSVRKFGSSSSNSSTNFLSKQIPKKRSSKHKTTKSKRNSNGIKKNKKLRFRATKVEIILKWGGALTPLGEAQAQYLGETLRKSLYPDPLGGGVLRLHATFRHDLKIRTSDEGRVMKTAASFAKGLLQLEGPLTPILVSLVRKDKGSLQMLDHAGASNENINPVNKSLMLCKLKMNEQLQINEQLDEIKINNITAIGQTSLINALKYLNNPREKLIIIHQHIGTFVKQLEFLVNQISQNEVEAPILYMGETCLLMLNRWRKLYEDFYKMKKKDKKDKNGKDKDKNKDKDKDKIKDKEKSVVPLDYSVGVFDLSKVPDVLDAMRYDLEHNYKRLLNNQQDDIMSHLYLKIKNFSNAYVPQEYGIDRREKFVIGTKVCSHLLRKIRDDLILGTEGNDAEGSNPDMQYMLDTSHAEYLDVKSLGRHVRTRLYFTSESHLHTLLNVLRYGHIEFDDFPNANNTNHPNDNKNRKNKKLKKVMDLDGEKAINDIPEYCYLTHLVIRVFENLSLSLSKNDNSRFRVELSFSPGANRNPLGFNEKIIPPSSSSTSSAATSSLFFMDSQSVIPEDSDSDNDENEDNNDNHPIFSPMMNHNQSSSNKLLDIQPEVSDYFENNPNDIVPDISNLHVAETVPLNRSFTLSATDLEDFLEAAINVAKSGTSANTSQQPSASPSTTTTTNSTTTATTAN